MEGNNRIFERVKASLTQNNKNLSPEERWAPEKITMSEKYTILINQKQAFFILSMFKKLDKLNETLNGEPMKFNPEAKEFRRILREETKGLERKEQ